jgi:hypothetical protein
MGNGSTGPNQDRVYSIVPDDLVGRALGVRPDPLAPHVHAFVEPNERVEVHTFEASLHATRPNWLQVWP